MRARKHTRVHVRARARKGRCTSASACACRTARRIFVGALPQKKNEWNKWKNHFYEMKGDVGM